MNSKELLKEYCGGVDILQAKLKGLKDEIITFRPERENAWTIKEHVIHVVDSEMNGFIRLKSIIAQPGSTCYVMDEDTWTKNIRRKNEDMKKYMSVFKLIRDMVFDLLIDEDDGNWNKDYFIRHYNGETVNITIENFLELYIKHLKFHLEHIDPIIREFDSSKKK